MIPVKFAAIGAAVSLGMGLWGGWVLHNAFVHEPHLTADLKAEQRSMAAIGRINAAGVQLGLNARDALDRRQHEISTVTTTILKEVPHYVPATVQCSNARAAPDGAGDGRVALADVSVGFGLLHNFAAAGIAPPAAPGAGIELGAPAEVGMPAVAETIVSNYGQCHAAIAEVAAWRTWDRDVLRPWWAQANAELAKASRR